MKANELRIGNWVYYPPMKNNYQVLRLNTDIEVDYEPIPLTEEILLKCGFSNNGDGGVELYLKPMILSYDLKTKKMYLMAGQFAECTDTVPCEYLHQLQNLYFALTGEELTINL